MFYNCKNEQKFLWLFFSLNDHYTVVESSGSFFVIFYQFCTVESKHTELLSNHAQNVPLSLLLTGHVPNLYTGSD